MCVELTHTERRCSTAKTMFEIIFFFDVLPIGKKRIIFRSIQHTYECRRTKIPVALKIVAFFFFLLSSSNRSLLLSRSSCFFYLHFVFIIKLLVFFYFLLLLLIFPQFLILCFLCFLCLSGADVLLFAVDSQAQKTVMEKEE